MLMLLNGIICQPIKPSSLKVATESPIVSSAHAHAFARQQNIVIEAERRNVHAPIWNPAPDPPVPVGSNAAFGRAVCWVLAGGRFQPPPSQQPRALGIRVSVFLDTRGDAARHARLFLQR